MKSKQESLWPMLLTVLALAVIGLLYFRGLQEPINTLHDLQLPSTPMPLAASPEDHPARPAEALVVNPIELTQAGRQRTAVAAANDAAEPLDAAMSPPQQPFESALEALVGSEAFDQLLVSDDFIDRMVVTVDNLSHDKLPARLWPLRPVAGLPLVNGEGGTLRLAADNGARYAAYLQLLQRLDLKRLAALYGRDYQRFQQAYVALGYPDGYFNDRLVDVIDHLLVTPDSSAPLALVQPTVMYKFADDGLEARSMGQKLLLRMGPANAGIVKARLRELRRLVTRVTP